MAKQTYTVLTPLLHDNKRYEIGAMIILEDGAEKQLLEAHAIEKPAQDNADEKPEKSAKK